MEHENYLSIFGGCFQSKKEFLDYILIDYNEDGDSLPSIFEKEFKIESYNVDMREVEYIDNEENNLIKLLEGFSYDEKVIPNIVNKSGEIIPFKINSLILLYDFKYELSNIPEKSKVKFIGYVKYK